MNVQAPEIVSVRIGSRTYMISSHLKDRGWAIALHLLPGHAEWT